MENVKDLAVQEKKIVEEQRNVVQDALKIKVADEADKDIAMVVVDAIDQLQKEIDTTFDPIIEQYKNTKREAEKGRKLTEDKKEQYAQPLRIAKNHILKRINDWKMIETRKREAEAKAEEDRLRKIEEDKRKAEAERLRKEAEELAKSNPVAAEKAQEQAAQVEKEPIITPVIQPKKIDTSGAVRRANYKIRITDKNKIPREWMIPDETGLGAFARAKKQVGEIVPGVECYVEYSDFTR